MLANTIILALGIGITVMTIVFIVMCISNLIDYFSSKEPKGRPIKFEVNQNAFKESM